MTTLKHRIARPFALSLGDRACLAVGMDLGVPVYTADRSWKKLHLPVKINVIR
jgi:PIN domain nuclease of toxin-antitoxin system